MARGVVQIHHPGIDRERAAGQQILGYGGQPVDIPGHQHETNMRRREPPHGGDGNARGRSQYQYP
jgi:hypothetical protein